MRSDPTIGQIAEKYGVSPAQIILAWHLNRGTTLAARSTSAERQKDNINVSFASCFLVHKSLRCLKLPTLKEEDFETINKLDRNQRVCNKANERGLIWGWTYEKIGW